MITISSGVGYSLDMHIVNIFRIASSLMTGVVVL